MKINILHRHNYWTEYLNFLLEEKDHFEIISSNFATEKSYLGKKLPLFNLQKHHNILSPGIIDDPTKHNRIHIHSLHSPGFFVLTHLITYKGMCDYHPESNFTMSLFESHYKALLLREISHPQIDAIRYQMIEDPRIQTSKINLDLFRFLEPRHIERVFGTGLICMSWFFMFVEKKKILEIFSFLKKHLKLTLVIHPCTQSINFIDAMKELKGTILEDVYFNVDRKTMMELYDKHEFIISDGSGACYEAMIRGCKPLAVRDLYINHSADMAMQLYYDKLEEEYFPFQNYDDIGNYQEFNHKNFIHSHYPFLYSLTYNEAKEIAKKEIFSFFGQSYE